MSSAHSLQDLMSNQKGLLGQLQRSRDLHVASAFPPKLTVKADVADRRLWAIADNCQPSGGPRNWCKFLREPRRRERADRRVLEGEKMAAAHHRGEAEEWISCV
jgi:hypothetical protein